MREPFIGKDLLAHQAACVSHARRSYLTEHGQVGVSRADPPLWLKTYMAHLISQQVWEYFPVHHVVLQILSTCRLLAVCTLDVTLVMLGMHDTPLGCIYLEPISSAAAGAPRTHWFSRLALAMTKAGAEARAECPRSQSFGDVS